jgi:putative intracellular protease/amidase
MCKLPTEYRFHRLTGLPAREALTRARADIAAGTRRYPRHFSDWQNATGEDGGKWFETPEMDGFRLVGFADEISNIRHTGWFANEFQDEKLRGVVYQLPARNGRPQYVPGYADPCNRGAARLWLGDLVEGDNGEDEPARRDAARCADGIAEQCAEKAREYNAAWHAGSHARDLDQEAKTARAELLAFLRELKPKKAALCDAPALIAAARDKVESWLETIRECRVERDELIRDCGSWERDAFNDGYGETIA